MAPFPASSVCLPPTIRTTLALPNTTLMNCPLARITSAKPPVENPGPSRPSISELLVRMIIAIGIASRVDSRTAEE